jgi:hypothetical protein
MGFRDVLSVPYNLARHIGAGAIRVLCCPCRLLCGVPR